MASKDKIYKGEEDAKKLAKIYSDNDSEIDHIARSFVFDLDNNRMPTAFSEDDFSKWVVDFLSKRWNIIDDATIKALYEYVAGADVSRESIASIKTSLRKKQIESVKSGKIYRGMIVSNEDLIAFDLSRDEIRDLKQYKIIHVDDVDIRPSYSALSSWSKDIDAAAMFAKPQKDRISIILETEISEAPGFYFIDIKDCMDSISREAPLMDDYENFPEASANSVNEFEILAVTIFDRPSRMKIKAIHLR